MNGEVVLQVKISRKDVYDAVRNLLLNEFKILPHDLVKAVEARLENKIKESVEKAVYHTYGFGAKVRDVTDQVLKEAKATVEKAVEKIVQNEVKEVVSKELIQSIVSNLFTKKE